MPRTTKTRTYALKGKDVAPALVGQSLTFPVFETREHELAACKSEEDAREMFQSAYDVWLQGKARTAAGKKDKDGNFVATLADVQKVIDDAVYQRRQEGTGEKREAGPIRQLRDERAEQIARGKELRVASPRKWEQLRAVLPASIVAEVEKDEPATATA